MMEGGGYRVDEAYKIMKWRFTKILQARIVDQNEKKLD